MWLSAALPIAAQTPAGEPERWGELADTIFKNYGVDDGVPISSVSAFAEDGDGFLWVGTHAGLARWDGYHFRVYRKDPAKPGALRDDLIWCLQPDGQGRIWVGTNGGAVSRYDRQTDSFVTIDAGAGGNENIPVRALAQDGADGMWAGTDRGLVHIGPDGARISFQTSEDDRPPARAVTSLLHDRSGRLWVGTKTGLMRQEDGTFHFALVPVEGGKPEETVVMSLLEASDGRIWAGTRNQGAYIVSPSDHSVRLIRQAMPPELEKLPFRTLAEGKSGELWLGGEGGIVVLDPSSGHARHILHDAARTSSLPHDFVVSLYRDRSGLMWAGTYSGMGFVNPTQDAVLTVFGGVNQSSGLRAPDVVSTLSASNGLVWAGYFSGGADVLDPFGHRLAALRPDPAHPQTALPMDVTIAFAQGGDGNVYLGTGKGLYRATLKGAAVTRLPLAPELTEPAIFSLQSDNAGLWVGTRSLGLWRMDYRDGTFRRRAANALTDQWIMGVEPTGEGRIWIGTNQGLYLLDPGSDHVSKVLPDPQDAQSQSGALVTSLMTDRKGRLWVGLRDGRGIAEIDALVAGEPPHVTRIGAAEGLSDLDVDALAEDLTGDVWASTASGLLFDISPDRRIRTALGRAEGVGTRSFTWHSGARTAHGELLFGGDGALTVLRPDRIKPWDWRPPVVITDLRVGGHAVAPPMGDGASAEPPLEILPKANSLTVEFAALDYSAPERNRYAYKLEGYDKEWVPTDSTRRLASYTNLPPGHYILHLRGSNRDGVWTEQSFDLPIRVMPAWYQTVWFRLALAVLALAAVWLLVRVRTSYLRQRQLILEQQVRQRTSELRLSNSQLETRTEELAQSLQEVAESRAKVTNLLDTSGQGFLSFGPDLIIEPDYSRACLSMLDAPPQGRRADEVLFQGDIAKAELFREIVGGALASEDSFKRDLLLSLLPGSTERLNRLLKLEYKRLDNGHLMVVLTDVTEERRLSKRLDSERQRLAMIVAAVTESRDFFDSVESFRQFYRQDLMRILSTRTEPLSVHQEIARQIHTFKGMLAQFNFEAAPQLLHQLEEKLSELRRKGQAMTAGQIVELVLSFDLHGALETDLTVLRNALGDDFLDQGKRVFLPLPQARKLRAVAERLLAGEDLDPGSNELRELFEAFRNLDKISLAEALATYDHTVSQVAKRLEKEVDRLTIDGDEDIWLDPDLYGPFLRSLVHVFRNAVAHGIEDPDERLANGKDAMGKIECRIRLKGSSFSLSIADDGAGLDVAQLRDKAVSLGLMSREDADGLSEDEAMALIFADAFSSRNQADELAGRGVGLAAVQAETRTLGGQVIVTSSPGEGTRFQFSLPLPAQTANRLSADVTGI